MTKEELIQFLKDHLKLEIETNGKYYGEGCIYTIHIKIDDEIITTDYITT